MTPYDACVKKYTTRDDSAREPTSWADVLAFLFVVIAVVAFFAIATFALA